MASDPEALAQLSRLLGEGLSPGASRSQVQAMTDQRFDRLVDGLIAEAAASDDVFDRASGFEFVNARLSDLAPWLSGNQLARLRAAVNSKIEAW